MFLQTCWTQNCKSEKKIMSLDAEIVTDIINISQVIS